MLKTIAVTLLLGLGACRPPSPRIAVVASTEAALTGAVAAAEINRHSEPDDSIIVFVAPYVPPISAEPAIQLAADLARDPDVIAVVGHANSSASLAAAQIYNAEQVVQVAPTSTAPAFAASGAYSFSMVPDDRAQGRFLAETILNDSSVETIAIGYTNDDYGRGLLREVTEQLAGKRVRILAESAHLSDADPARLVHFAKQIRDLDPDLLLWLSRPPPLYSLIHDHGVRTPVLGSDGLEAAVTYLNPEGVFTGVRFVRFIDPQRNDSAYKQFERAFRRYSQAPITAEVVFTYDAIMLLAEGIRSGIRSGPELRDYVAAIGRQRPAFQGAGGPVRFNEDGAAIRSYQLARIPPPLK